MDKIAQAKLDEELAHVIAEATQSRVSITEAIVMIRKMEKAGWVFTNAKLEADMKKAADEKVEAEREKLAAEKPLTKPIIPDPILPPAPKADPHPVATGSLYAPKPADLGPAEWRGAKHDPYANDQKPAEVATDMKEKT